MIAEARIVFLKDRLTRYNDQAAYKELFTAFYPRLMPLAVSIIKSRQSAEEIVSDVFINIWQKRSRLEHISNLKLYLYTATRNTALNYRERENPAQTIDLAELPVELGMLPMNPEGLLITAEMKKMIREAVNQLPNRCRLIFKLVKEDELKYREVAELLKISVKTVEAQMTIALRRIGEAVRFDQQRSIPPPLKNKF
ncbi:MAG TPA: RNA polymerase sigma-70 factor [Flavihumibacter sp.]|nr:RNA polymerase sigma-70 factor [Flavihumibacter sp.]